VTTLVVYDEFPGTGDLSNHLPGTGNAWATEACDFDNGTHANNGNGMPPFGHDLAPLAANQLTGAGEYWYNLTTGGYNFALLKASPAPSSPDCSVSFTIELDGATADFDLLLAVHASPMGSGAWNPQAKNWIGATFHFDGAGFLSVYRREVYNGAQANTGESFEDTSASSGKIPWTFTLSVTNNILTVAYSSADQIFSNSLTIAQVNLRSAGEVYVMPFFAFGAVVGDHIDTKVRSIVVSEIPPPVPPDGIKIQSVGTAQAALATRIRVRFGHGAALSPLEGDFLLCFMQFWSISPGLLLLTIPAGWSQLLPLYSVSPDVYVAAFYRLGRGPSFAGTWEWVWNNWCYVTAVVESWTGADTIDAWRHDPHQAINAPGSNGLTPTDANCMLASFFATVGNAHWTPPAGHTEIVQLQDVSSSTNVEAVYKQLGAAGPTGPIAPAIQTWGVNESLLVALTNRAKRRPPSLMAAL